MATLEMLEKWLLVPGETPNLEFKEAKKQYDSDKLMRYCVALANEGGGHLVLGVSDKPPRRVVGTSAFSSPTDLNKIHKQILDKLHIRVDAKVLHHPKGRVLVFEIPSRPTGQALAFEGAYLMRSGDNLVPMPSCHLKRIFAEDQAEWVVQPARSGLSPDEVVSLLDTQTYFELLELPYPTNREGVLSRLAQEQLITETAEGWDISNIAAILLAKKFSDFPHEIARKAPRVIVYNGTDKLSTKTDIFGKKGYAVGFSGLVTFVHDSAPQNRFVEQIIREEVKMFPKQALRELIANALVHQDFGVSGSYVTIEMYNDRVEISNPGVPAINVERFIDAHRARNERVADIMRRLRICEEKGSGIDKVVEAAEIFQLPAPDFRVGEGRTTAVLFAHQDFADMSRADRIRACYQHCCLMYVCNRRMTNQSLRTRFGVPEAKVATVSQVIGATKEAGFIKPDASDSASSRYARYLPFWA